MSQSHGNRWGNNGGSLPPFVQKAKLLPKQRDEIRTRLGDGESPQDLALEFGVTAACIRRYS